MTAVFDARLCAPEIALAAGLCAVLLRDLAPQRGPQRLATGIGCVAAILAMVLAATGTTGDCGTMLHVDTLANLARAAAAGFAALILFAWLGDPEEARDDGARMASLLALALGASLCAIASHFVPLWLGLELIAMPSYVLCSWRAGDSRAAEAGMKYVLFGGACSAVMLFGISHLYGLSGTFDFAGVGAAFATGKAPLALGALGLAGVGIAMKLTLVPFHFYAPDVYQGAPSLSVAAISALPKFGVAAALVHALQTMLPSQVLPVNALATALSVAAGSSVVFAAVTALVQRDGKRILAFSGIGHAAAVLLAIGCGGRDSLAAGAFYLGTYALANAGAFVCLHVLQGRGTASLDALAGVGKQKPLITALLCLFLASLAGVPPLAGFLAKWNVLQVAFVRGLAPDGAPALAVAALLLVVTTAVSAWSYLLIVRAVAFAEPKDDEVRSLRVSSPIAIVLLVCALATVAAGLWLSGMPTIARSL